MADRDNKAIKGLDLQSVLTSVATEIKKKQDKTDSGIDNEVIASALVDLATRLVGVENRNDLATLSDLQKYCKQVQTAKSSPSASSTAIAFIDTISQNENGDITATKKTVRSATTEQTGVVQLQDSIADGVTSKAPTVNAVYDALALKENLSNKVKSTAGWSQTLSDDKYPSEKLVKNTIDSISTASTTDNEVVASALDNLEARLSGMENRADLATIRDLLEYCQVTHLENISNWNELVDTGIYEIGSQRSNVLNAPEQGRMTLYVIRSVTGDSGVYRVTQLAVGSSVYYRMVDYSTTSNAWGSWKALLNASDINMNLKQDRPSAATSGNIAVFNNTKDTVDSGKTFLTASATWDGTSDVTVPTTKAVHQVFQQLTGAVMEALYLKQDKLLVQVTTSSTPEQVITIANNGYIPYLLISWTFGSNQNKAVIRLEYCGEDNNYLTFTGNCTKGNYVKNYTAWLSLKNSDYGTWYYPGDDHGTNPFSMMDTNYMLSSSYTINWNTDDNHVPTAKAVDSRITTAISGQVGGFLGVWDPAGVSFYQAGNNYKNGDWIVMNSSGTAAWHPNNTGSAYATLAVNMGDQICWNSEGNFVKINIMEYMPHGAIGTQDSLDNLTVPGVYDITTLTSETPQAGKQTVYVGMAGGRITQLCIGSEVWYRASTSSGSFTGVSWHKLVTLDSLGTMLNSYVTNSYLSSNYWSKTDNVTAYSVSGYKIHVGALPSTLATDTLYFV